LFGAGNEEETESNPQLLPVYSVFIRTKPSLSLGNARSSHDIRSQRSAVRFQRSAYDIDLATSSHHPSLITLLSALFAPLRETTHSTWQGGIGSSTAAIITLRTSSIAEEPSLSP